MEQHPTCLFVQVIIGCITAEAGRHGERKLPMFFCLYIISKVYFFPSNLHFTHPADFIYRQVVKIFCFRYISAKFPLERYREIGYNTEVYAQKPTRNATNRTNERK